jgi:hypothetical protein
MADALVGYTGFVGSTLRGQRGFDAEYRSTNIGEIEGQSFGLVVCAGAPAQKWIANREPQADLANIDRLIGHLGTVRCQELILISTVDVFGSPLGVDEASPVEESGLHAYGLHRRKLEHFVERTFERSLIVRLPGLVGRGLRKNVIFDLLHDNNLSSVDPRAVFQFYPMARLWRDIEVARQARLRLLHLTAEPVSVAEVAVVFGKTLPERPGGSPARYDMRTRHAGLFGAANGYQVGKAESLEAIGDYARSERTESPRESRA